MRLTPREIQVKGLFERGITTPEAVATELHISVSTARKYLAALRLYQYVQRGQTIQFDNPQPSTEHSWRWITRHSERDWRATILDNYKLEWAPDETNSQKTVIITTRLTTDNATHLIINIGQNVTVAHRLYVTKFTTVVQPIIAGNVGHMSDPIDIPIADISVIRITGLQALFTDKEFVI